MHDIPSHYKKYYVSYKKIKRIILRMGRKYKQKLEKDLIQTAVKRVDKRGMKMLPPFLFSDIITKEIKKINKFAEKKYIEIIDNLMNTYKKLKSMDNYKHKTTKEDMEKNLDLIGCDIIHFDYYTHKNCRILMKLGFFFDHIMNISINQWLLLSLIKEKFCNINIDELIVYLSLLYSLHRSLCQGHQQADADCQNTTHMINFVTSANPQKGEGSNRKWIPPETFERTSTKFLMKYEDIVYTKVKIIKHLPYLIFGMSNKDLEESFENFVEMKKNKICSETIQDMKRKQKKFKPLDESQQITSVYLDNEEATCYSKRILRYENAQLIRFRWYNENDGNPDKIIFVERKIHHEEWTGETSTKERFELEQKYVFKFMNGQLNMRNFFLKKLQTWREAQGANATTGVKAENEGRGSARRNTGGSLEKRMKKNIKLATEIQKMIIQNRLEPVIRTSYLRCAFQQSNDNSVRISIDTNVSMLNECVSRREEHWCRLAEEALRKNEIRRLNYSIIEVKLKVEKIPKWVQNILNSNHFINAYKYSKYQTAMALLHPDKVKYIPLWIHANIQEKFKSTNNYAESTITRSSSCQNAKITNLKDLYTEEHELITDNVYSANYQRQHHAIIPLRETDNQIYRQKHDNNECIQQRLNQSSCNSLQEYNMLHKTALWITQNYNRNKHMQEKINLLKIDPKINFAAERTFLHYTLISVYITLLALFLEKYKNQDKNLDTLIILLLATAFSSLISSYFFFLKRIEIIELRKTKEPLLGRRRFDSFYSPIIFLLLILFSIILSIYFNFNIRSIKVARWDHLTVFQFLFRMNSIKK
ncbi:vacuolar transporter chaperone [Plasmodium gonderi]|uniref:Vacuolar transporter chaperone n=1 Tax=Plasmodium gonderi TaxID=77519 RepID=A0A1Y1JKT5_PLAGO|nr:vacuolar transporter chaperone [Plasmodium gonderi]GAW81807.1 vacuolar transporter chaperone [Plasmodium gonderi]